ncbi:MAG: DNA polymerase III subunit gamma/tau [Elusimicrobiota bacterium]
MESLALKYRPKYFSELIGQEVVSKTLANAVKSGKIFHSYLFYGPRGCGKTSSARILAKALNCHLSSNADPCNKCISCREISQGNSIDVIEIDAASYTQVQNIRDVIIDNVSLSPSRDKYKVYILDEVHMLSTSAFNALLKTIEEPPPHAVFILATTEIHKVPLTIISRCQTFRFKPIPLNLIVKRLEEICKSEGIKYEKEGLDLIAASSSGAMRDSLSLLEKVASFSRNNVTFDVVGEILGYPSREIIKDLSKAILQRDIDAIHSVFTKINEEGIDAISVLKELRDYFSKSFLAKKNFYQMSDVLDFNPFLFVKLARKINRIIDEIRYSDTVSLMAETFIYTLIDSTIDIDNLIKKIESSPLLTSDKEDFKPVKEINKVADNNLSRSNNMKEESWAEIWKKVLNSIINENIPLYNMLLSSDIKLAGSTVIIDAKNQFEKDFITKNIAFIEKYINLFSKKLYKIEVNSKKKVGGVEVLESKESSKEHEDIPDKIKFKNIDNGEELFPEGEKIKKVFGHSIIKIIKNK